MPSSLSSLLADKLDLSEEQAQELLERLSDAIRDHADATGVHVSGLGTFRQNDGTLTFEPAPSLARYVNQSFEGLPPEAASRLAPPDASEQTGAQASPSMADLLSPLLTRPSLDAAPDAFSLTRPADSVPAPVDVWTSLDDSPPHPEPEAASGANDASEGADDSSAAPTRPSRPRRGRRSGPRIAAAVLAALFLVGAGWLILGQQGVVPPPPSVLTSSTEAPTASNPGGPSESSPASTDTAATDDTTTDETTSPSDTNRAEETSPDDQASTTQWALVVASRGSRSDAEDHLETYRSRLSDEDMSLDIRAAETDNGTRYRVAVGEFESRQAALEAMEEYQSQLPDGVWLLRLP